LTIAPPFDAEGPADLRPAAEAPPDPAALRQELEALYRSHFGKVLGYFIRCGMGEALAREQAQEVFLNAWRALDKFRGQSKLSTWLWTIAQHQLLNRRRQNHPTELAALQPDGEPLDPDSLSESSDPALILQRDCVRRGFMAFHRDHPERAQVIYLAIVEGWTREELGEYLGRTPHAATEYLSQCRAKFRPYIECCDDD